MAINKIEEKADSLRIDINNGDLSALHEIMKKWNFKDKESALRFGIAILTMTEKGSLYQGKSDGSKLALQPAEALINKDA